MDNNKKYLVGLFALIIGFFVYRYITNPLVVTVSGTGKVTVPASGARLSVSIVETGDDVNKVEEAIKAKIAAVRLSMVTNGVNEKSLSQTQMQIMPLSAVVSGAKGYSAQVNIVGQVSDVSNLSGLVVKLYQSGASIVSQPVIEVENQQELENAALKMAMADADKNLKMVSRLKMKLFRKTVSVQQASSGNTSTATKVTENEGNVGTSIEVAKAVSVVYQLW
ncbi:hypothetical protein A2572_01525 [Candidatus Collierbacteria bacterium RIFOXYD1_FULL_40_9]|uniref:DUF541 domain-containing protein n=1 Tax=Candidatus Collierbacteria bacterium RIFOXYD1_FULL_40_9 TaxID=1817731 RepID=A0A1F5FVQ6_9BACT|nr:MAG: hypothetical protein A2572_01525 [Candidatus Collierbacteria bacterium RIFOXYD1_FULL_40_9]